MRTILRFALLALVGFGFILSLPCAAQESDPSILCGTWALNTAKSKIDKRFPISSQTLVITYTAPKMQFHYTTNGKDLAFEFTVDDKERSFPNPAMPGAESLLKATWKKAALITENRSRFGSPGNKITSLVLEERWTLSSDGKVLTKKTGSDMDWDRLYVFDKQ